MTVGLALLVSGTLRYVLHCPNLSHGTGVWDGTV